MVLTMGEWNDMLELFERISIRKGTEPRRIGWNYMRSGLADPDDSIPAD
jgi:hypothetical protein